MKTTTLNHLAKRGINGVYASLLLALMLIGAKTAYAQSDCAANFKVSGDPRNGASYLTYRTIPHLDIHSALGQVEKISLDSGLAPGAENYEGDEGTLTVVRKDKSGLLHQNKGFPILIKANKANSRLIMALQLNQGQVSTAENMQNFMCGILDAVSMDSAGAAAAATAHAETHSDEITNITATELGQKLTRRAFTKSLNPQDLENQYTGRVFRIDGQVSISSAFGEAIARSQSIQNGTNSIELMFNTSKVKTGLLGTPAGAQTGQVICRNTDPKQLNRFMALRNGDYATVIGKVVQVVANQYAATLYLSCSFEK
jgi:hypothetical protein